MASSCSGVPDTEPESAWVGAITTEGDVTTVLNQAGSVWGGRATLVEEASIGVDIGDDQYMLGRVISIYATGREIYVLDIQVPALRVFDFEGRHLRDIGGEGQGPGEFLRPVFVTGARDGRILLLDAAKLSSVIVYDPAGEPLQPFRMEGLEGFAQCCGHPMAALEDGSLLLEIRATPELTIGEAAVQRIYADGRTDPPQMVPRLGFVPTTFRFGNVRFFERSVPLAPELVWAISPMAALIVGVSDQYLFQLQYLDGSITRVIREIEPVATLDIEAAWHREFVNAGFGWNEEGDRVSLQWDERIPPTKPAFRRFIPAASGEVWVQRDGPAEPIPNCELEPSKRSGLDRVPPRCHETTRIIDAFDSAGRYLGDVEIPDGMILNSPSPFLRDDVVVALVLDEAEVSHVKRYRLAPPGASASARLRTASASH